MKVESVGSFFRGINWENIAIAPLPTLVEMAEQVVHTIKDMDRNQSVAHFFSQICWENDGSAEPMASAAIPFAQPAPQKSGMSLDDLGDFLSDL
jgi:hypothetical protein